MYTLEELIQTFADHAERHEEVKDEGIKHYKEEHPDEEVPEWLLDPFNICIAMHAMCMEIKKLRDKGQSH